MANLKGGGSKKLDIKPPWSPSVTSLSLFLSSIPPDLCFSAKHILSSDPSTLVLDSLKGLCKLNPRLVLDAANKGTIQDTITLISSL